MPSLTLTPPYLSIYDPDVQAEGSIDPLGLQRTYERLAERILPSITVRMSRPRFLTAMVVGSLVGSTVNDEIAADGITPAWLVFEWLVLEAFVRRGDQLWDHKPRGIPGIAKTRSALQKGRRLNHSAYLKTPKIFGFSGVYRRLAHGLEILGDDLELDEGGWELLKTWEREQGLDGFAAGSSGLGAELREDLRRAHAKALSRGQVERSPGWAGWAALARHLDPSAAGPRESKLILDRLLDPALRPNSEDDQACLMRREFLARLIDHGKPVSREEEADYFRYLISRTTPLLQHRLEAIDAYEGLCRLLNDGFRLLLHMSTVRGPGSVDAGDYAKSESARSIARRIQPAARRLGGVVGTDAVAIDAPGLLERFEPIRDAGGLFDAMVEHHETIQRSKPPEGKRPWFERLRGIIARPQYLEVDPRKSDETYVHWYRTGTACTFLQDLRKLRR